MSGVCFQSGFDLCLARGAGCGIAVLGAFELAQIHRENCVGEDAGSWSIRLSNCIRFEKDCTWFCCPVDMPGGM